MKAIFWCALLTLVFVGSLSAQARDKRTDDRQPASMPRVEKPVTAQPLAGDPIPGCSECVAEGGRGVCYESYSIHDSNWADCIGGQRCWYMPGSGLYCIPYCSESRCLVV